MEGMLIRTLSIRRSQTRTHFIRKASKSRAMLLSRERWHFLMKTRINNLKPSFQFLKPWNKLFWELSNGLIQLVANLLLYLIHIWSCKLKISALRNKRQRIIHLSRCLPWRMLTGELFLLQSLSLWNIACADEKASTHEIRAWRTARKRASGVSFW